ARSLQGISAGFTWSGALAWLVAATPRERRGRVLGNTMGAAGFGSMLGPVLGAAAAVGRSVLFSALAAVAACLFVWTLQLESAPTQPLSTDAFRRAVRHRSFVTAMGLIA